MCIWISSESVSKQKIKKYIYTSIKLKNHVFLRVTQTAFLCMFFFLSFYDYMRIYILITLQRGYWNVFRLANGLFSRFFSYRKCGSYNNIRISYDRRN